MKKANLFKILICSTLIGPLLQAHPFASIQNFYHNNPRSTAALAVSTALAGAYAGHKVAKYAWQTYYRNKSKKSISWLNQRGIQVNEKKLSNDAPVVVLFAHGLGGTHRHGYSYEKARFIPKTCKLAVFDFQDSPALENPTSSNIAQEQDAKRLMEEYCKWVQKGYRVILWGCSRGAATIITFLGLYSPRNVIAAISESPFDDARSVVDNALTMMNAAWIPGLKELSTLCCSLFMHRNFSPYGVRPIDVVHKIDPKIPVLIVCSQEDALIPAQSSIRLAEELKKAGHRKTHVVTLKYGPHANLVGSRGEKKYRNDAHAFLKKYQCPCNALFARASKHKELAPQ
ncbi:MAG TPA: prolyl oligopeptidase family serine peptidase [Candidatus Babeliales bacterium]|nr:prolyl oligopeptidase family serine peptidase [Candidatus Babeliales bacterium]